MIGAGGEVGLGIITHHGHFQGIAGPESQGGADGGGLVIPQVRSGARTGCRIKQCGVGIGIFQPGVLVVVANRQPACGLVTDGPGNGRLHGVAVGVIGGVKLARSQVKITAETLEIRLHGHVIDRAAGGVAAEQGTLGALEYFHPVDIEHREGLALGNGDITLVQVDRIGRLDNIVEVVLGDAANGELGVLAGDVAAGMDPRCERGDIKALLHSHRPHLGTGKGGDDHGYVLQVFLPLLGGDGDLLQNIRAQCGLQGQCACQQGESSCQFLPENLLHRLPSPCRMSGIFLISTVVGGRGFIGVRSPVPAALWIPLQKESPGRVYWNAVPGRLNYRAARID